MANNQTPPTKTNNMGRMSDYLKCLNIKQSFVLLWWCLFNKRKAYVFVECYNKGMHAMAAYKSAKQTT